jgi:hypothetical protein
MKKSVIIIALILLSFGAFAQTSPKPSPKPRVQLVYKLASNQYYDAITAFETWRRLVPYDPNINAMQKVEIQKNLDMYISTLKQLIPDTMKIDTVKVMSPIKKKK